MRSAILALVVGTLGALSCGRPAEPTPRGRQPSIARSAPGGAGVRVDLTPRPGERAPLLVFLEGGRAPLSSDDVRRGPSVAEAMRPRGVAVATLTFGLGEQYPLAACARDVASVIDELEASAERYGFDRQRLVLGGQGVGASIAAMVALERKVAGVVAIRGTYDFSEAALARSSDAPLLATGAAASDVLAEISPIARARRGSAASAPPFLLLSAGEDDASWAQAARAFARALEAAGAKAVERYVVPRRDARTVASFAGQDNELGALVASFVRAGPTPQPLEGPWGVKQRWGRAPPLDHEDLWRSEALVVTRPTDGYFQVVLAQIFGELMEELGPWPLAEYKALPLGAYLASRPESEVGAGEHLVVTNMRGEQLYLTRDDVARHEPVIVIGVDDERNLYRVTSWYRLDRASTFGPDEGPMPTMIRPLGPFLFFPKGAPPHLEDTTLAAFGLSASSFRFQKDDPLASVRTLPEPLRQTLTGNDGCLKCHALRGAGARAHHVRASDGKPHGGFAMPLEEYPPAVLRRFLFEQDAVAASLGVEPLRVPEPTAKALYDLVQKK